MANLIKIGQVRVEKLGYQKKNQGRQPVAALKEVDLQSCMCVFNVNSALISYGNLDILLSVL